MGIFTNKTRQKQFAYFNVAYEQFRLDLYNVVSENLSLITVKFEPEDYYFSPEGYIVFTEKYHLKRGYCCQNNCRHCPFKRDNDKKKPDKN